MLLLTEQTDGTLGSAVVLEVELAVARDAERGQQCGDHRPLRHTTLCRHVDLDDTRAVDMDASVAA
jgi:hypothetical protein